MHTEIRSQLAFRLIGRLDDERAPPESASLRPALAARLHDLSALRYDFPLVLIDAPQGSEIAVPLTTLVDRALEKAAAVNGEDEPSALRVLEEERRVRGLAARGVRGKLSELWDSSRIGSVTLPADGELVDCTKKFPLQFLRHAWRTVQARKAKAFHAEIDRLVAGLLAILDADTARSPAARTPQRLRQSMGASHGETFDFEALARILARSAAAPPLAEGRRRRIRALAASLESQRFFLGAAGHNFEFDRCAEALAAFRARLPSLVELVRAIAAARLELDGRYVESEHDAVFAQLTAESLGAGDLARFPDYLVFVDAGLAQPGEEGDLAELLCAGVPAKVLVQTDDLFGEREGAMISAIGAHSRVLAGMALGLGDVFVLQSSASNLPRVVDSALAAMRHPGAAMCSVYSGAGARNTMPAYLNAAAAMESRAFPAFSYDPGKDHTGVACISLENNPQHESDWPVHSLDYEDREHQRRSDGIAFTVADFIAADERFARFFLESPASDGALVIRRVDDQGQLHDFVAAEPVIRQVRRTRAQWLRLRRLAEDIAAPAPAPAAVATPVAPAPQAEVAAAVTTDDVHPADEAYIETPRCTTCEECRQVNDRMFAYDANKQAFIADPDAGTYRDLVEAAENCQVSIIHPGKPRNPDEPGLDELVERAAAFQ